MPRRGGTGSWLASFVVFGAAVVAIAVAVSGLADRHGQVAEQPAAEAASRKVASSAGTLPIATVAVVRRAPETAPVVRQTAVPPDQSSKVSEPVTTAYEPTDKPRVASASTGTTGDASPFKLELLPVLDTDGADFDADAAPMAAPARPAAKVSVRKAPVPTTR